MSTKSETTLKAAVLHAAGQPLTIEDVVIEKPKRNEVLVRTTAAGLCHSDLHFMEGSYPTPVPVVLGHEAAGVVEAVGEDVTYLKPGDHVISCLSVFCGQCEMCLSGHMSICQDPTVKLPPGVAPERTAQAGTGAWVSVWQWAQTHLPRTCRCTLKRPGS